LPVFRFNKAFTIARDLKAFLNLHAGVTRGVVPNVDQNKKQVKKLRMAPQKNRRLVKEQRKKIKEQRKRIKEQRERIKEQREKLKEQTLFIAGTQKGAMITSAGRSGPNSPAMDIPRLIVRPRGGLANRMQVITSFQILAKYSGRGFELCWAPSVSWSDEDLREVLRRWAGSAQCWPDRDLL
jgi:hypothetical protein